MTREEFEDVVRRALADLRVADQVLLVGVAAVPDSEAMTAELRLVAGSRADEHSDGGAHEGSRQSDEHSEGRVRGKGENSGRSDGRIVTISVGTSGDAAHVASETRAELRRALRMCPLCQRMGHVEKLRNAAGQQEACLVRCPACGDFEIDQESIRRFRAAWERHDTAILDRLPSLSERTRAGSHVRIAADNWKADGS
jgi:hypothetical protein